MLLLIGRWPELEDLYRQDLEQAVAAGLRRQEATSLLGRGELQGWRNEHRQAEETLGRAAFIFRELGDATGRLRCENGLAVVYTHLGLYQKAEALITACSEQARQLDHRAALCSFLNSHAVLCRMQQQYDRAIACLEERMAISLARGDASDIASSHMNIAVLCSERGQHGLALDHNRIALEMSERTGDIMLQHHAVYNHASILYKLGRNAESLGFFGKALVISRHVGDDDSSALILEDIARVEAKLAAQGPCHEAGGSGAM
ncbi:MAG: tetratricopeptide repeat protein [Candidatus Edwardsbacteria bacterium]|nr:tetratricopeptide repeat protein [Candidatus Edwardsbacteria bacterium]